MQIACYRSTSSFPSMRCFSCAPADGAAEPFQQARPSRERQPAHKPDYRVRRDKQRQRRRDPDAHAVETVHQTADEAVAQPAAQPEDDVRRAVLVRQQVGDPPGREDGQDEARQELIVKPVAATQFFATDGPRLSVPANAESHQIGPATIVKPVRESGRVESTLIGTVASCWCPAMMVPNRLAAGRQSTGRGPGAGGLQMSPAEADCLT